MQPRPGTALRCGCDGIETLAVARPQEGLIEIRDKRHGLTHTLNLSLTEIVRTLDPKGTTVQMVRR